MDATHAFATGPTYPLQPPSRWALAGHVCFGVLDRVVRRLRAARAAAAFARHARVGSDCRIGVNAWCANPGPRDGIILGNGVVCRGILRAEDWSPGTLVIGDSVYIGDDCLISCAERIEIGALTLLAHGAQIFDNDSHPLDPALRERDYVTLLGRGSGRRPPIAKAAIEIGAHVWIGFNAIVTKGVRIGDGSVIAAGSVVTDAVEPYTVVAGNPARLVRRLAQSPERGDKHELVEPSE